MKCKNQPALACPIDAIGASARPMAVFSGFFESYKPPLTGDARGILLANRNGHQNGQQSRCVLHCRFVDCCAPDGGVQWLLE